MSAAATEAYAAEIREWLFARLSKNRKTGAIDPSGMGAAPQQALYWWMLEGRVYPWLDAPLWSEWDRIDEQCRRLLLTHNPRRRLVDTPEGETDWLDSAFQSLTSHRATYVVRASAVGLSTAEREALLGWRRWISLCWRDYVRQIAPAGDAPAELGWVDATAPPPSFSQLRRWAHAAKRSRWPLLRNVVAESIRCILEPQTLTQVPLPEDHASIFEMLCMVRILKALAPEPEHVRWVTPELGNSVELPGLRYEFQKTLAREAVLATTEFDHGLREAMNLYGVRVPTRIDGLLLFDVPRKGLHGILIEAKSGSQGFDAAVHQLKCYRASLSEPHKPLLIWGITEAAPSSPASVSAVDFTMNRNIWMFSAADEIGPSLKAMGLTGPPVQGGCRLG